MVRVMIVLRSDSKCLFDWLIWRIKNSYAAFFSLGTQSGSEKKETKAKLQLYMLNGKNSL